MYLNQTTHSEWRASKKEEKNYKIKLETSLKFIIKTPKIYVQYKIKN